jgi:coenzyme F420-reducing hydrogenase gamma subunit
MKPKVAFFDFACCEGCQLQIANLEEDIIGLVNLVDVVEFREVLTGKAPRYDIAFIEGSITRPEDEERLKDIRVRSTLLVAFGACAATGGVNKLKNLRGTMDSVKKEVYGGNWSMPHLETYPTKAVHEVVKVDLKIHGCPMTRSEFLKIVKALVLGTKPEIPDYPVCVECKMKGNECMFDKGHTCIGPITRAGCGAICPSNNSSCEGCRGTVPDPNKNAMHEVLEKYGLSVDTIKRHFTIFAIDPEVGQ